MNIHWDAAGYAQHFAFVPKYGEALLALLDPKTARTVLDLGCGGGALTGQLQTAGYTVCGMDADAGQLAVARQAHPDIRFFRGDATDFSLETPVDAVFSNAVLHWIDRERQPDALSCVFRALRAGGQFVFEMGGAGCGAQIHAALRRAFAKRGLAYRVPFFFPTVGEYAPLLEAAGFRVTFAALFDRPTPLAGERGMEDWIRMFVQAPFAALPAAETDEIIREAVEDLRSRLSQDGVWTADYVRLRCKAVKPA